jgi:hypothetical protein
LSVRISLLTASTLAVLLFAVTAGIGLKKTGQGAVGSANSGVVISPLGVNQDGQAHQQEPVQQSSPQTSATRGEPLGQSRAYYVTIGPVYYVTVDDAFGNNNNPIGDMAFQVPGAPLTRNGEKDWSVIIGEDAVITLTFQSDGGPVDIEIINGVGNRAPRQAVRYLNVTLPVCARAQLAFTGHGIPELRYDSQKSGVFDATVAPTVNLTGQAALDVDGPDVVFSTSFNGKLTVVSITAIDHQSGVKSVDYSLDGSNWLPYTGPFSVNGSKVPLIFALAQDNAGNRTTAPFAVPTRRLPTGRDWRETKPFVHSWIPWENKPDPCAPPKPVPVVLPKSDQEGGLVRLEKQWLTAWAKKDLPTVDRLWADDALGLADRAYAKPNLDSSAALSVLRGYSIKEMRSVKLGADAAVLNYRLIFPPRRGSGFGGAFYASSIWLRRNGKWSLVLHQDGPPKGIDLPYQKVWTYSPPEFGGTVLSDSPVAHNAADEDLVRREMLVYESWKNRDASALGRLWADGLLYVGEERIPRDIFLQLVTHMRVKDYTMTDIKVVSLGSDAALISYMLVLRQAFALETNYVDPKKGYTTSVWAKRGGEWQVVFRQGL